MKETIIIAIACITILESIALMKGVDGAIFGIAIAAISGLVGYQVKSQREKKHKD